jgi:mono/diheme cytochrome c family protein
MVLSTVAVACSSPKASNPVARGHAIYVTNCTQCHNPNPNLPGLLGPPIAGSSRELIHDRLANLSYPPGYRPKRNTHQMRAFPELAPDAGALAAFLRSAQQRAPHPAS